MSKYRFFMHYNKRHKKMSVHFKKVCYIATNVICQPECQTHYNKTQPHLVLRGWTTGIVFNESCDSIVIK